MNDNIDESIFGLSEQEQKKILILFAQLIGQLGGPLDEMCFTPLRDVQVFLSKIFSSSFGANHLAANGIALGFSFLVSLPYLAKVFNKNKAESLHEVLHNLQNELGINILNEDGSFLQEHAPAIKISTSQNDDNAIQEVSVSNESSDENTVKRDSSLATINKDTIIDLFQKELQAKGILYVAPHIITHEKKGIKSWFRQKILKNEKKQYVHDIKYVIGGSLGALLNKDSENKKIIDVAQDLLSPSESSSISSIDDIKPALRAYLEKVNQVFTLSGEDALTVSDDDEKLLTLDDIKKLETKLTEICKNTNEVNYDSVEKLLAFLKIAPIFYEDKGKDLFELQPETTIKASREKFIQHLQKLSWTDCVSNFYQFVSNSSFNFWLFFESINVLKNNPDTLSWDLKSQSVTVFGGMGTALLIAVSAIINHFRTKPNKDISVRENGLTVKRVKYDNDDLKHQQMTQFFIKALFDKKFADLGIDRSIVLDKDTQTKISNFIEQNPLPKKSFRKRLKAALFSDILTVEKYEEIIQAEVGIVQASQEKAEKKTKTAESRHAKARGFLSSLRTILTTSVTIGFIEWFASAMGGVFMTIRGATTKAYDFLFTNPVSSGITGLVSLVVGFALGILLNRNAKKKLKEEREKLKAVYEANKEKFNRLKELEKENAELKAYFVATFESSELMKTLKVCDDRAFRRMTTKKTKGFTAFKKWVNRLSLFIGKLGGGILLYRLIIMAGLPLLLKIPAIAAIPALAALIGIVSVPAWPAAVIALGLGLIWGIAYLYQYIQERKVENAKRFLEGIDNRLLVATEKNNLLKAQINKEISLQQTASSQECECDIKVSHDQEVATNSQRLSPDSFQNINDDDALQNNNSDKKLKSEPINISRPRSSSETSIFFKESNSSESINASRARSLSGTKASLATLENENNFPAVFAEQVGNSSRKNSPEQIAANIHPAHGVVSAQQVQSGRGVNNDSLTKNTPPESVSVSVDPNRLATGDTQKIDDGNRSPTKNASNGGNSAFFHHENHSQAPAVPIILLEQTQEESQKLANG